MQSPIDMDSLAGELDSIIETDVKQATQKTFTDAREESNAGSLQRTFIDAMSSLFNNSSATEALVGGVIATAFGGSEAGAKAIPIGMSLGKDRVDGNMQRELAALRQGSTTTFSSPASFVDKQGNPVLFNRRTGKYYVGDREIPASEVRNLTAEESARKTRQGDRSRDQRDEALGQSEKRIGQAERRLEHTIQEAEDLSPKQFEQVTAARQGIEATNYILSLVKNSNIGPVLGRARNVAEFMGMNNPEFTALKQQIGLTLATYQRSMSGLAVTDAERATLEKLLPNTADTWAQFQTKAEGFKKELNRIERRVLDDAKLLQGRGKGFSTSNKERKIKDAKSSGQETIIRRDPRTGRNVIYDAKTKKPLGWE